METALSFVEICSEQTVVVFVASPFDDCMFSGQLRQLYSKYEYNKVAVFSTISSYVVAPSDPIHAHPSSTVVHMVLLGVTPLAKYHVQPVIVTRFLGRMLPILYM